LFIPLSVVYFLYLPFSVWLGMIYALVIVTAFHTTPRRRQSSLLTARSRRQKAWPRMKLAHALRTHPVPALAALVAAVGLFASSHPARQPF